MLDTRCSWEMGSMNRLAVFEYLSILSKKNTQILNYSSREVNKSKSLDTRCSWEMGSMNRLAVFIEVSSGNIAYHMSSCAYCSICKVYKHIKRVIKVESWRMRLVQLSTNNLGLSPKNVVVGGINDNIVSSDLLTAASTTGPRPRSRLDIIYKYGSQANTHPTQDKTLRTYQTWNLTHETEYTEHHL